MTTEEFNIINSELDALCKAMKPTRNGEINAAHLMREFESISKSRGWNLSEFIRIATDKSAERMAITRGNHS